MAVIRVDFLAGVRVEGDPDDDVLELFQRADAMDEDPDRFEEAERLYLRILTLEPTHAKACVNLGNILYRRGNAEAAAARWVHASDLDPSLWEPHYNLGYLALENDLYNIALDRFQKVLEIGPPRDGKPGEMADTHYHLAATYEIVRHPLLALLHWKAFLRIADPTEHAPWRRHAEARVRTLQPK